MVQFFTVIWMKCPWQGSESWIRKVVLNIYRIVDVFCLLSTGIAWDGMVGCHPHVFNAASSFWGTLRCCWEVWVFSATRCAQHAINPRVSKLLFCGLKKRFFSGKWFWRYFSPIEGFSQPYFSLFFMSQWGSRVQVCDAGKGIDTGGCFVPRCRNVLPSQTPSLLEDSGFIFNSLPINQRYI